MLWGIYVHVIVCDYELYYYSKKVTSESTLELIIDHRLFTIDSGIRNPGVPETQ